MEASGQPPSGGSGGTAGILRRIRGNPRLAIAVTLGVLLVLAWIGWAIYVGTERGVSEAIGVLIAWPALIVAATLIALPFVGAIVLIRRLQTDSDSNAAAAPENGTDDASRQADPADPEKAEATSTG